MTIVGEKIRFLHIIRPAEESALQSGPAALQPGVGSVGVDTLVTVFVCFVDHLKTWFTRFGEVFMGVQTSANERSSGSGKRRFLTKSHF